MRCLVCGKNPVEYPSMSYLSIDITRHGEFVERLKVCTDCDDGVEVSLWSVQQNPDSLVKIGTVARRRYEQE